jgi:hypothetical protein
MTAALARPASATAWYLYGVVSADAASPELEDGLTLVTEGPLAGVSARVPADEFDEQALPKRLADPVWLERKVRDHEQVLEAVLAAAPVVPCRFCTVYRSEDDLRRFLVEQRGPLEAAIERFTGRVELGVKAFLDRERFASGGALRNESIRELAERVSGAEGGRAYLERRRLEQLVTDELMLFKARLDEELHARLRGVSDEGFTLPLQRPEVSGREKEMLFNGAYLVADRARFEEELAVLADEHRADGVELELTGPWPPFNFVPAGLGGE